MKEGTQCFSRCEEVQGLESRDQFLEISNYLKTCPTRFPGAQSASLSTLSPLRNAEGQQLPQHRVRSPQRQLANALGKRQFVVDRLLAARLLCPWNFPGKSTAVGCRFFLQKIFLTQGLNPCLLHCRQILLPAELPGKPLIMVNVSLIFFFNFLLSSIPLHGYNMKVKVKLLSHVRLFGTPWTVAYQAPQSMEFSRQEYCSGLPFPSPGESSQPRDQTWVSRTTGRHFTV